MTRKEAHSQLVKIIEFIHMQGDRGSVSPFIFSYVYSAFVFKSSGTVKIQGIVYYLIMRLREVMPSISYKTEGLLKIGVRRRMPVTS